VKITIYVATNRVGSKAIREIVVDDEEWELLSMNEKDELMLEELWQTGLVEWGWVES
jgi:hypothetical protein